MLTIKNMAVILVVVYNYAINRYQLSTKENNALVAKGCNELYPYPSKREYINVSKWTASHLIDKTI